MSTQLAALRTERAQISADVSRLQLERSQAEASATKFLELKKRFDELYPRYEAIMQQIVKVEDVALLQEAGIYQYRHPLQDAVAYKVKLSAVQGQIKDLVRAGGAVTSSTTWTVNGSVAQGAKMVREYSKLMLRAYNAEADTLVSTMKPYTLESATSRLEKTRAIIAKLGGTMNIRVSERYHQLRVAELELTADYLAKAAEEKERERADRERLREEERARREIEREQERLRKEHEHYSNVLALYRSQGNEEAAAQAEATRKKVTDALDGLERRAANIRAGYVYVISNVGAFGPRMVKIGLTRRLEPRERILELGDASVPFRYDTHMLVFSEDAVGLETHLHHALADRRVNMVNNRREFFYATPAEVKEILAMLKLDLLTYVDAPEALEWYQSETARKALTVAQRTTPNFEQQP